MIVEIGIWQLLSAYIFVLILLFLVKRRGLNREKTILLATFRMTIQLILVGYILDFIFDANKWYITILIILIMETFAIYNIIKREKREISSDLKKVIALAMSSGSIVTIIYFMFVVIQLNPWYSPVYFIPISGMLIGNAMTALSLSLNKILTDMKQNKQEIETTLMLGATPSQATKNIRNGIFDSAILPTINSMMSMGIIILPGMMTGQIIAGAPPTTAVIYQIAIMLGILGSVSLCITVFLQFSFRTFFNKYQQLK